MTTTSTRERLSRRLIGAVIGLLAACLIQPWQTVSAAPETSAASAFIENVGRDVLKVLRAEKSDQERFGQLIVLLNESIDLDLVARLALGKNWRRASDTQKHDYLKLFRVYALQRHCQLKQVMRSSCGI